MKTFSIWILSICLFTLIFSCMRVFWFNYLVDFEFPYAWGFTSSLEHMFVLIVLIFFIRLIMMPIPWRIPWLITLCIAAAVWTVGMYYLDIRGDRGNFGFYMYGAKLIDDGEITEHGYAVAQAILFSKVTAIMIFTAIWLWWRKLLGKSLAQ